MQEIFHSGSIIQQMIELDIKMKSLAGFSDVI
jgi:hypothetical protein